MKISFIKTAYIVTVIGGVVYAFVELRGPAGIPGLMEKRPQAQELERVNQKLHREIEERNQRIQRLEQNPAEQEFEIRQRLKLAKPGEKIYILDDAAK
jgi:cell division protein FtsB